uniref:Uncharacterized protein n=1 Tax=Alexandrium monilatum TaxID=311494 RepID=A0A7S4Q3E7_9DINO
MVAETLRALRSGDYRDPHPGGVHAGGIHLVTSAALLPLIRAPPLAVGQVPEEEQGSPILPRGFSTLWDCSQTLPDEVGTPEDYEKVGRYIGDLLTRRHYRWVSRQEAVLQVVDRLLPELRVRGKEQLEDLERLLRHADALPTELGRLGDRQL